MAKRLDINIVEINREQILRRLETIRDAISRNIDELSDWDELVDGSDTVGFVYDLKDNN